MTPKEQFTAVAKRILDHPLVQFEQTDTGRKFTVEIDGVTLTHYSSDSGWWCVSIIGTGSQYFQRTNFLTIYWTNDGLTKLVLEPDCTCAYPDRGHTMHCDHVYEDVVESHRNWCDLMDVSYQV